MPSHEPGQSNRLLGYPPEARLLIINADDLGMCHSVNQAVFLALAEGVLRSTSVMVPCAWALHAFHFLAGHPEVPFGIHLTALTDGADYRWGPLTAREKVSSLVDPSGSFYDFDHMAVFFARVRLDELEMEFRAQIESLLAAGLHPSHLDWHSLRLDGHADIADLLLDLAMEYGLALRVMGRPWIEKVQQLGLPCNEHDFLDSYGLDPAQKPALYARLLHELPPGLSEWALHPALDSTELLTIEPMGNHVRQADFDFLVSPQAKQIIAQEGIQLLDYRTLQDVWSRAG